MNAEIKAALESSVNETEESLAEYSESVHSATQSVKSFNNEMQSEFIISNPYKKEGFYYQKQFICKGKHQYRQQINDNLFKWICQCGRKL